MVEVFDNFLNERDFKRIEDTLLSSNFPWYYNDSILSYQNENSLKNLNDFQFVHTFYTNFNFQSSYSEILYPIIEIINPDSLLRIKANLTTVTEVIKKNEYHVDQKFPCKVAILYINTNNGFTYFEDGTSVSSVRNRFVVFDSNIKHFGTTSTDSKVRAVLNLNYIKYD